MLEPRNPNAIAIGPSVYTGRERVITMKEFAKRCAIRFSNIPFDHYDPNPFKRLYFHIKEALMNLVPAEYYHRRRENMIIGKIERLIQSHPLS